VPLCEKTTNHATFLSRQSANFALFGRSDRPKRSSLRRVSMRLVISAAAHGITTRNKPTQRKDARNGHLHSLCAACRNQAGQSLHRSPHSSEMIHVQPPGFVEVLCTQHAQHTTRKNREQATMRMACTPVKSSVTRRAHVLQATASAKPVPAADPVPSSAPGRDSGSKADRSSGGPGGTGGRGGVPLLPTLSPIIVRFMIRRNNRTHACNARQQRL
jgi:hypothetical protein